MEVNKGLLWKEWKQNWLKCWAAFVLMSLNPIISPALGYLINKYDPMAGEQFYSVWLEDILRIAVGDFGQSSLGMPAVWVVLVLGVLLLAQERNQKSLDFLIAMPVSRREIVTAKYLLGTLAIIIIMLVNLAALMIFAYSKSGLQLYPAILTWFAVTTSVLLAVFSLAFLAAAGTGSLIASLVGAIALVFGPQVLLAQVSSLLTLSGIIGGEGSRMLMEAGRTLTLPEYIKTYHYAQTSLLIIPLMLAVAGAFFTLTVKMFENNSLERDGRILMLAGRMKRSGKA